MSRTIWLLMALLASLPARAETLVASWYGPGFDGRRTASGCAYDQDGLSAASRVLPLGTVLEVTYGGRTVRVVVDDRGPYVVGRGLDLSRGAAARLGLLRAGVARVTTRIVGSTPLRCRAARRPAVRSAVPAMG